MNKTDLSQNIQAILLLVFFSVLSACSGSDGAPGVDGNNGLQSLILVSTEPAGENCPFGGSRIDVGVDTNGNGVLDSSPNEIEHTEYVCSQYLASFDGLVFSEDPNYDGYYELFASWPSGGSVIKIASSSLATEYIREIALSPDKTHVAFVVYPSHTLYVANLLSPYVPPVKLSLNVYTNERAGFFAWSPDSQHIAFTLGEATSQGKNGLFTANPEGTAIATLTSVFAPLSADITNLAWSPDSQHIAYVYDFQVDATYQLYTVTPNGTNISLVSDPAQAVHSSISWAPNSSRIAYMDAVQDSLYTATPAAGTSINVSGKASANGGAIIDYQWSPDSQRLAFRANFEDITVNDLFITAADKLDSTRISQHLTVNTQIVSNVIQYGWSVKADYLAYLADQEVDNTFELFVASMDASSTKVSSTSSDVVSLFAWSTKDSSLAYTRANELNFVNADGTNHKNVDLVDRQIKSLYWSPDGNYLAYTPYDVLYNGNYYGSVKVVDNNANTPLQVSPAITDGGMWDVNTNLEWSPDSSRLAFEIAYPHSVATTSVGMKELYAVFPDGSGLQKLSIREKPNLLDGYLNLGVRQFRFQGDSKVHQ